MFISYTHDSPELMDKVLNLANRLRGEGVPCDLDQFHESPPEGWPRWMMNQIEGATFVLVICTENYNQRFRGKAPAGVGKGAKWEGAVITQELYDAEAQNTAYLPILLSSEDEKQIPLPLRAATYYDLSQKDGFENLLRRLTLQRRPQPLPVGTVHPIRDYSAELKEHQFEKTVSEDFTYYQAKLMSWPANLFSGEELIPGLQGLLEKVEGNPQYRERNRAIWATLYRMIGGAYLIHDKLGMPEKLLGALPFLKQSQELWPEQRNLAEDIGFLDSVQRASRVDPKAYLTSVLRVLRGPDDPEISGLAERMANGLINSPTLRAQSWLLNEATPKPIWGFLQAVQLMLKKERNMDAEIEVTSKMLDNGSVEVQAKVGPNVLLWEVNADQKTFKPSNQLTTDMMGVITQS